jgi:LPS sulfotransferase NodH
MALRIERAWAREPARCGATSPTIRPMGTAFILLATQRTGSSWVQEMLNSHPHVKVYTELFLAGASGNPTWDPSDIEFANTYWEATVGRPRALRRPYSTTKYLQRVFDQSECDAVGFKYMYDQIPRSPEVLLHAAATRTRIVHLVRRNLLDTVISAKLALRSGIFHQSTDDRPRIPPWAPAKPRASTITIEPRELMSELQRLTRERRRMRAWLRLTRTPFIEVEYETLALGPDGFGEVLDFLRLPGRDANRLNSSLKKLRRAPREAVVENLDEIEATLAGTRFEQLLHA